MSRYLLYTDFKAPYLCFVPKSFESLVKTKSAQGVGLGEKVNTATHSCTLRRTLFFSPLRLVMTPMLRKEPTVRSLADPSEERKHLIPLAKQAFQLAFPQMLLTLS